MAIFRFNCIDSYSIVRFWQYLQGKKVADIWSYFTVLWKRLFEICQLSIIRSQMTKPMTLALPLFPFLNRSIQFSMRRMCPFDFWAILYVEVRIAGKSMKKVSYFQDFMILRQRIFQSESLSQLSLTKEVCA